MQMNKDNTGDLFFNQILEYKTLCLLASRFDVENEDRVKLHIKYRHKVTKMEMEQM